ncbi:MAG: hypothetical protein KDC60_08175, partial [Bacteroidetes bacterium]|nr:hypothetical protein [Bacteroidota bacterium]
MGEIAELKSRLADEKSKSDQSQEQVKALSNTKANLEKQLSDSVNRNSKYQQDLQQLNAQIQEKEEANKDLTVNAANLKKQLDGLLERNQKNSKELQLANQKLNEVNKDFTNEIGKTKESYESQIQALNDKVLKSDEIIKANMMTIKDLQDQQKGLNIQIENASKAKNNVEAKLTQLQTKYDAFTERTAKEREPLQLEIAKLQNLLKERETQLKNSEQLNTDLRKDLANIVKERGELQAQVSQLDGQVENLQAGTPQKIVKATEPLQERIVSLKKSLEEQQNEMSVKDQNIKNLSNDNNQLNANIKQITDSLNSAYAKNRELEDQLVKLKQERGNQIDQAKAPLLKAIEDLKDKFDQTKTESEQKENSLAQLSNNNSNLEKDVARLTTEKQKLEVTLEDVRKELKKYDAIINAKDKLLAENESGNKDLQKKLIELSNQNNKYVQTIDKLNEEMVNIKNSVSDKVSSGQKPLIEKIENLQNQLTLKDNEHNATVVKLNEEIKQTQ